MVATAKGLALGLALDLVTLLGAGAGDLLARATARLYRLVVVPVLGFGLGFMV